MKEKNILLAHKVYDIISIESLKDSIEILANVFIMLGCTGIKTTADISPINIANIVIEDKKNHGETLYNALATQGLVLLAWLNKE